jgi:hypothetical protein
LTPPTSFEKQSTQSLKGGSGGWPTLSPDQPRLPHPCAFCAQGWDSTAACSLGFPLSHFIRRPGSDEPATTGEPGCGEPRRSGKQAKERMRSPSLPTLAKCARVGQPQLSCELKGGQAQSDIQSVLIASRNERSAIHRSYVKAPSQNGLRPAGRSPLRRQAAQACPACIRARRARFAVARDPPHVRLPCDLR